MRIAQTLLASDAFARLPFVEPARGPRDRSAAVRRAITEVAAAQFLDHGYAAVSTHDISRLAGTHQGLIRYHFGSKLGLWQAAMDSYFGRFRNELHATLAALDSSDDRDFLHAAVSHVILWHGQHRPLVQKAMTQINQHDDESLSWLVSRHIRAVYDLYQRIFQLGQQRGLVRPVPLPNLYYILFLCGSIFALRREIHLVTGLETAGEGFDRDHAEAVVALLLVEESTAGSKLK